VKFGRTGGTARVISHAGMLWNGDSEAAKGIVAERKSDRYSRRIKNLGLYFISLYAYN